MKLMRTQNPILRILLLNLPWVNSKGDEEEKGDTINADIKKVTSSTSQVTPEEREADYASAFFS